MHQKSPTNNQIPWQTHELNTHLPSIKKCWELFQQHVYLASWKVKPYYHGTIPAFQEKAKTQSPIFWMIKLMEVLIISILCIPIGIWVAITTISILIKNTISTTRQEIQGQCRKAKETWEINYVKEHAQQNDYQI